MKEGTFFAAYVATGFLTGSYYWNHRADYCIPEWDDKKNVHLFEEKYRAAQPPYMLSRCNGEEVPSFFAGAAWPAYWSARAALWATK